MTCPPAPVIGHLDSMPTTICTRSPRPRARSASRLAAQPARSRMSTTATDDGAAAVTSYGRHSALLFGILYAAARPRGRVRSIDDCNTPPVVGDRRGVVAGGVGMMAAEARRDVVWDAAAGR